MTITRDDIKQVMDEILAEHTVVSSMEHAEHHTWLHEHINAEKARKEVYWEITKTVTQWGVLGILGAMGYWIQKLHVGIK